MSDSLQPHEPQHARPPYPSPTPGVHPNPCPLSQWCHPTISSSAPEIFLLGFLESCRDLTQFSMKGLELPLVPASSPGLFSWFPIISVPFLPFQQDYHFLSELCALKCCLESEVSSEKSPGKCSVLCSHVCFPSPRIVCLISLFPRPISRAFRQFFLPRPPRVCNFNRLEG